MKLAPLIGLLGLFAASSLLPVPAVAEQDAFSADAVDGSITAMLVSRTLNAGGYWDLVFEVNTTSIANVYSPCGSGLLTLNCRVKAHAPPPDIIDIATARIDRLVP